jgi:hypothetical protein
MIPQYGSLGMEKPAKTAYFWKNGRIRAGLSHPHRKTPDQLLTSSRSGFGDGSSVGFPKRFLKKEVAGGFSIGSICAGSETFNAGFSSGVSSGFEPFPEK